VGGSPRPNVNADVFTKGPDADTTSAIVQLKGDPIGTNPSTKPLRGAKIDFNGPAVRSYRAQLNAKRNEFKSWLRAHAPTATVTNEYDIAFNGVAVELNGTPLATIAAAPMVQRVEYDALYYPSLSQSYQIINASDAWNAAGGRANAGAGIKIGDIDTGIDETHPFFDPTGFSYPPGFPKCDPLDSNSHQQDQDRKYVSPKVIVAKVFSRNARQQGIDAQAIQDHGTHTAGIAAGVTGKTAVVNGMSVNDMSGIAPGA
jgi:subtilisin family serine protease